MAKKFFFIIVAVTLLLSGCFGLFRRKEPSPAPVAPPQESAEEKAPPAVGTKTPRPDIPSFNDGDIYLKALAGRDIELCKKIGSANLKSRCEKVIQKQ